MAGKIRHLLERAGRYHARVSVPPALRTVVGQRELTQALGADRGAALRRLPGVVAGMLGRLEAAREQLHRGQPGPPALRHGKTATAKQMAIEHYRSQDAFDRELRASDPRYAALGSFDDSDVATLRRAVSGAASDQELAQVVGWAVRKFEKAGQFSAAPGSTQWREAATALAVAELESLQRTAERDEGDFNGKPEHPLLQPEPERPATPGDALAARIIDPASTKPLADIVPDFVKERRASDQTNYESVLTARLLDEALCEAKPIYAITRADVHAFKRMLSEAPANCAKRFPGMTVPDAIKANKARNVPYATLDPKTINHKYLSRLHAILAWCVRNDLLPDNPAASIKVDAPKEKRQPPRVNFSPSDLTRIFAPNRFAQPYDESQWAMLVSLFSGTRASETAQLKLDSIMHERGVLVLAIEEATKTRGSRRVVPIHSTLIAMGFEKRVKALRAERASHFFPAWYQQGVDAKKLAASRGKRTLNHHWPKFVPKRFNVTYLPKVGISDPTKSWHSFRHSFKTGLARAGVSRDLRDALAGHDDNSAGAGYVHDYSVAALREAIEKLTFDGFPLTSGQGS